MAPSDSEKALLRLEDAVPVLMRGSVGDKQFEELDRLIQLLDKGSVSLNQRATTLAALAVAALGAFGVFASRLDQVHPHGLVIASAVLLAVASITLALAGLLALWAAAPGGNENWSKNFATWATCVIDGSMSKERQLAHFAEMIPRQLRRNKNKAIRMKWAYWSSRGAVVAATLAVGVVALGPAFR